MADKKPFNAIAANLKAKGYPKGQAAAIEAAAKKSRENKK